MIFRKLLSRADRKNERKIDIANEKISSEVLTRYEPFRFLLPKYNLLALDFTQIIHCDPDAVLSEIGEPCHQDYFLLEGSVQLTSSDNRVRQIIANTPASYKRLISLRPSYYKVTAGEQGAKLISMPNMIVEQLNNIAAFRKTKPWEDEVIIGYAEKEHLFDRIERELIFENIVIPTHPITADHIYQQCLLPGLANEELADLIRGDIAILGKVMKAANSLFFHGMEPVNNIQEAIDRLGHTTTINLVKHYTTEEVFFGHKETERLFELNYKHALELAIIANLIAKQFNPDVDEELVFNAAMLSYIGKIAIFNYVMDYINDDSEIAKIESLARDYYIPIGKRILDTWNLSSVYCQAVENINHWTIEADESTPEQDILVCAHVHQAIKHKMQKSIPPLNTITALQRVFGENFGPEQTIGILNAAREEFTRLSLID